jgi:hypothetical protein
LKLSKNFISETKLDTEDIHKCDLQHAQHLAAVKKIVDENPDLPFSMIQDILIGIKEFKAGKFSRYVI